MANDRHFDEQFRPPRELAEAWNAHSDIVKLGDPILREVAKPISRYTAETHRLIDKMLSVMKEASGLGLAAPQVGVSSRLLVYDTGEGSRVLVNPVIVSQRGEQMEPQEGCLSIPGLQGTVKRAMEIKVKAFDERGRAVTRRAIDLEARVIQHEIDHLDGVLFIDKADPETLVWLLGPGDEGDGNEAPRE